MTAFSKQRDVRMGLGQIIFTSRTLSLPEDNLCLCRVCGGGGGVGVCAHALINAKLL